MDVSNTGHSWKIPDALWAKLQSLLPPGKPHPVGCHHPRVDDRKAMDAIFYRVRTGCQWKSLDATGICSGSSAHRRFQEWTRVGVFKQVWAQGLLEYDELKGIEWEWQAMDGAMTKAPLGQEQTGPNPTDRAKQGVKRSLLVEGHGLPIGLAIDGANRNDFKMTRRTLESILIARPELAEEQRQNLCLDKGYDYDEVRELGREFGYTLRIRARKEGDMARYYFEVQFPKFKNEPVLSTLIVPPPVYLHTAFLDDCFWRSFSYTESEVTPVLRTCGESSPLSLRDRSCVLKSGVCQTLVVCEKSHREMKGKEIV